MDIRDLTYNYVQNIMRQDAEIFENMCDILEDIDELVFDCEYAFEICEPLLNVEERIEKRNEYD